MSNHCRIYKENMRILRSFMIVLYLCYYVIKDIIKFSNQHWAYNVRQKPKYYIRNITRDCVQTSKMLHALFHSDLEKFHFAASWDFCMLHFWVILWHGLEFWLWSNYIFSAKPGFFHEDNRANLFEVEPESGMLLNTDNGTPMPLVSIILLSILYMFYVLICYICPFGDSFNFLKKVGNTSPRMLLRGQTKTCRVFQVCLRNFSCLVESNLAAVAYVQKNSMQSLTLVPIKINF